jgi:hypothetical protein
MIKWYITMFRRLLNAIILNPMVIWRANSQGKWTDHLKFRTDKVQALHVQHGCGIERKVSGRHSMDNSMPRLLTFPREDSSNWKEVKADRGLCCVLQDCKASLCVEGCFKTYHTKFTIKVKSINL